jgi:hypothetical protein
MKIEIDFGEIFSKVREKLDIKSKFKNYRDKKEVEVFNLYKKTVISEISTETYPCASALLDVYSKFVIFPFISVFYSWKNHKRVAIVFNFPFFKKVILNKVSLLKSLLIYLGLEPLVKDGELYLVKRESLEIVFTKVSGIVIEKQSGSIGIVGENPSLRLLIRNKGCIYAFEKLLPYILEVKSGK